jgi:multiple sugar transport system substrate-binding protein
MSAKTMSRRGFLKAAAGGSAALLLAACAAPAAPAAPPAAADKAASTAAQPTAAPAAPATNASIVVACFYALDQTAGWKGLISEFEKTHPGAKISTQVSPWVEYLPKILTQIASGTPPDVLGVENTPFIQFVQKGALEDLTPLLEKDAAFKPTDFFPKLIDRYTIDNKIYGIPYDVQPQCCLFYNKKLFDDAGVSYPTKDWKWDNLLDAAKKTTKMTGDKVTQYGFWTGESAVDRNYFGISNGGRVVDDVKKPTKVTFDDPKLLEGIKFWADLINKYKVSPNPAFFTGSGQSAADVFSTGKLAMFHGGYWEFVFAPDKFKQVSFGLQMAPAGPDGKRGYSTGGTAYCVGKGTKQKDIAWEFVKYFMGMPGNQAAVKEAKYGVIYPPAYIPAYNSEVFAKIPNPPVENMTINGDAAEFAVFTPHHPKWAEMRDTVIVPTSELIANGEKTPEAALTELQTKLSEALASA